MKSAATLLLLFAFGLTACSLPAMSTGKRGARQLVDFEQPAGMANGAGTVYCYQTLGKPDCYYEPQDGANPNRMIGAQPMGMPVNMGTAMPDGHVMQPAPQPPVMRVDPAKAPVPEMITKSKMEIYDDASAKKAAPAKKKKSKSKPKSFDGSGGEPESGAWADKPL